MGHAGLVAFAVVPALLPALHRVGKGWGGFARVLCFAAPLILPALALPMPIGTALTASGPITAGSDPPPAIFVANAGCRSVTTYPFGASGDVAPIAPGPGLCSLAVAADRAGNIYVANLDNNVTVYPAGSNGNVAPSATIGSNTGLNDPLGIALDGAGG